MCLKINNEFGLADIKRTAVLDREYIGYQLNLYRIGYKQCYGIDINFLKGIHLRENIRKFIDIPINEELVKELLKKFLLVNSRGGIQ